MQNFWEIVDYRDFLKAYYQKRKKHSSLFSYRMFGEMLGLDASFLCRVVKKQQDLSGGSIAIAKKVLGLSGRASEYFDALFALNKAKTESDREIWQQKISALRDVYRRELQSSELLFLRNWWIAAIRAYVDIVSGNMNPRHIATQFRPQITEEQIQEAISLLKELKLVQVQAAGRLKITDAHLTVSGPEKVEAVRHFQKEILQLASNAVDTCAADSRDISTLTLAVDEAAFEDIREILREARRVIQKRTGEVIKPDRVMELSMAFFPVTEPKKGV